MRHHLIGTPGYRFVMPRKTLDDDDDDDDDDVYAGVQPHGFGLCCLWYHAETHWCCLPGTRPSIRMTQIDANGERPIFRRRTFHPEIILGTDLKDVQMSGDFFALKNSDFFQQHMFEWYQSTRRVFGCWYHWLVFFVSLVSATKPDWIYAHVHRQMHRKKNCKACGNARWQAGLEWNNAVDSVDNRECCFAFFVFHF